MRFLADESCDASLVRALREAGHDVTAITEQARGLADKDVLDMACAERRVLLTKDKDFGELVFRGVPTAGVILLRFPPAARLRLLKAVVDFVSAREADLFGSFVVMTPGGARVSVMPMRND